MDDEVDAPGAGDELERGSERAKENPESEPLAAVTERYSYRMTPYLAALLRGRAADDPLTLQFLPSSQELLQMPYESQDPIGDRAFSPIRGIVHRYPDRVLLKVAHACPVYCRFCFRREMVGRPEDALQGQEPEAALD